MPRIRSLKPSFWADESIATLSRDARLLTIGLISFADDQGRFLASITAINGYVYPHDDLPPARVRRWLGEIRDAGIIHLYTVARCDYGVFPHWAEHQRINRSSPSLLPSPNGHALTEHSVSPQ